MTLTVSGSDSATARRTVPQLSDMISSFITHYRNKFVYFVGVISRRADFPKAGKANPIAVISIENLEREDKHYEVPWRNWPQPAHAWMDRAAL